MVNHNDEECDDGNGVNGDGCENDCTVTPPRCGDENVDDGETCDPPGEPAGGNGNDCREDCTVCGDGLVNHNDEECDDGNGVNGDGCENDCTPTPRLGACCLGVGPGTPLECQILTEDECLAAGGLYRGDGTECGNIEEECLPLEVTMESMSAEARPEGVLIRWTTASEIDTVSFRVLRELVAIGDRGEKTVDVVGRMIPAAGHGLTGASYQFLDNSKLSLDATAYFIEDVDIYGKVTRHGPIEIDRSGPADKPAPVERKGASKR